MRIVTLLCDLRHILRFYVEFHNLSHLSSDANGELTSAADSQLRLAHRFPLEHLAALGRVQRCGPLREVLCTVS